MVKNRWVALGWRVLAFGVILGGILVNLGVFEGRFATGAFMYYTILSNLLALVMFSMLIFRTARDLAGRGVRGSAGYFARFEFVCTVDLLLTFGVYWVLLAPEMFTMGNDAAVWSFNNLSVHMIAPLACLVDYVLFTRGRHLKYSDVYKVLIFPLSYFAVTTVTGLAGYVFKVSPDDGLPVHYPYPFMDYDRSSLWSVVMYVGALVVVFVVLGHLFYFVDRRVRRKK